MIAPHGPECEGPDEDGDWYCGISSDQPGLCPTCLHRWNIERQMTKTKTVAFGAFPERTWYLCYTCAHGC